MNTTPITVLVVDDEPDLRQLHKVYFESAGFQVLEAETGKSALEVIEKQDPVIDVVVSDVVMPEMNGYELCKAIKEDSEKNHIIVVFVSALASLEEKAKGYSYGADDYFIKPLQPEELQLKIKTLIEYRNKQMALQSEVQQSQKATMQIMNFYSDLGQVLEFYKASINANNYQQLCDALFDVMDAMGLKSTVQILTPEEVLNFGQTGPVSPLEANVIELSRAKSRFFEYGVRLIINYKHFSLLIKNMPIHDAERCGTLRDSLGILCNAMEARIDSLLATALDNKKNQITADVKSVLQQSQALFAKIEQDTIGAIEGLKDAMEDSFISLGLTEAQEESIRNIINNCHDQASHAFEPSHDLYRLFAEINANLDTMQSLKKD